MLIFTIIIEIDYVLSKLRELGVLNLCIFFLFLILIFTGLIQIIQKKSFTKSGSMVPEKIMLSTNQSQSDKTNMHKIFSDSIKKKFEKIYLTLYQVELLFHQ